MRVYVEEEEENTLTAYCIMKELPSDVLLTGTPSWRLAFAADRAVAVDVPDELIESYARARRTYEAACEKLEAYLRSAEAAKSTLEEAPPPE